MCVASSVSPHHDRLGWLAGGHQPHPRLWGAFPRVLGHYARDVGLFPLEEAVRKMTSLTAAQFGLANRGLVREGYAADLVLFDPAHIKDTATFAEPIAAAEGIACVIVNGAVSYGRKKASSAAPAGCCAGGASISTSLTYDRPGYSWPFVAAKAAPGNFRHKGEPLP